MAANLCNIQKGLFVNGSCPMQRGKFSQAVAHRNLRGDTKLLQNSHRSERCGHNCRLSNFRRDMVQAFGQPGPFIKLLHEIKAAT